MRDKQPLRRFKGHRCTLGRVGYAAWQRTTTHGMGWWLRSGLGERTIMGNMHGMQLIAAACRELTSIEQLKKHAYAQSRVIALPRTSHTAGAGRPREAPWLCVWGRHLAQPTTLI